MPAGGSWRTTPAAPGAVSAGSGAWRGVSPASRSFWRASGTVSPVTCGTATSLGRAERYAANAATTTGTTSAQAGSAARCWKVASAVAPCPATRTDMGSPRRSQRRGPCTSSRATTSWPGPTWTRGGESEQPSGRDVVASVVGGRDRRGQVDVGGGVAVVADVDLGVGAAAGAQLLRAQLERDDGVRGHADAGRGGADAAAAGEGDHAQRPLGGLEVGVGRDVDGDVGLALLARGDVDGAREDLGPAGGHALDGQLEVLGARGLVVHAHDEARVRGRLDDDLRRPGVIRASRHAERDADRVPMPSCSPFPEHLLRG